MSAETDQLGEHLRELYDRASFGPPGDPPRRGDRAAPPRAGPDGFLPGVAAGLFASAELAATRGDSATARRHLDEATEIARDTRSDGVLRWIGQVGDEHHLT